MGAAGTAAGTAATATNASAAAGAAATATATSTVAVVDVLKALGDETRLRMVNLLADASELCSCQLEGLLELSQSNASRHLAKLRGAGIISPRRSGQWVYFSLAHLGDHATELIVQEAVAAMRRTMPAAREDLARLRESMKGGAPCATHPGGNHE